MPLNGRSKQLAVAGAVHLRQVNKGPDEVVGFVVIHRLTIPLRLRIYPGEVVNLPTGSRSALRCWITASVTWLPELAFSSPTRS